jgi:type II secretory ATPase GspE/PulE/Tfp pilus assembly ATPase PilB-like protein
VGVQIDAEKKAAYEKGPPVNLMAKGGASDTENNANLLLARQSPGFVVAKEVISDAVGRRAEKIMLDYTRESVAVRLQIDGVWHDLEPRDRETGDVMLAVLKKLASLNPEDRKSRQEGKFGCEYEGNTYTPSLVSQGTKTGERAIVSLSGGKLQITQLADSGMREKMQEQLKEMLGQNSGLLILSAMPGGGLSTCLHAALRASDRLMRDFVAVEDQADPEQEVENVEVTTYNAAGGEAPDDVLPKLIRKEPDVIVCRDLPNAETVRILCREAADRRLVISTIRAKEAVEALLRVLLLKVPAAEFAPTVTAVLNVRLVRKLCDSCKQPYAPPPELLKKLGLPAERIKAFYRQPVPQEGEKLEPCAVCGAIGYRGRTGVYELLVVDDKLRNALVKQPKLDILRQIARKSGHKSLQDEGLLQVVRGVTSLPELKRVLNQ